MKKCTYCGKEYPDDITHCPLDGQPVVDPNAPARAEPVSARNAARAVPRPGNLIATCCFILVAVGLAGGIPAWMMIDLEGISPAALLTILLTAFAAACPIAMLMGKEWGRTLFTILTVAGFVIRLVTGGLQASLFIGLVVSGIILFFLFDPKITAFFRQTDDKT